MRRFKRSVALSVALSSTLLAGSLTLGFPLLLTACQAPGAIGSTQFALGGDGSIAFENIPGDNTDPFEAQSVTPAVSSRLHACAKLPYATIGNLLASRGVNLAAVNPKGQCTTHHYGFARIDRLMNPSRSRGAWAGRHLGRTFSPRGTSTGVIRLTFQTPFLSARPSDQAELVEPTL